MESGERREMNIDALVDRGVHFLTRIQTNQLYPSSSGDSAFTHAHTPRNGGVFLFFFCEMSFSATLGGGAYLASASL